MLTIDIRSTLRSRFTYSKQVIEKKVTRAIRLYGEKNCSYEISIVFCGSRLIRGLNSQYRQKNTVTDVLSFPDVVTVGGQKTELGEIFICVDVAKKQAREHGISVHNELELLATHGMLHLLGFIHNTPSKRRRMQKAEENVLQKKGLIQLTDC